MTANESIGIAIFVTLICVLISMTPDSISIKSSEWSCTKTEIIAGKAECVEYQRTKT